LGGWLPRGAPVAGLSGWEASGLGVELVLRFIGGILAGASMTQLASGLVDSVEPPRDALLAFSMAAAAFAVGFAMTPYLTTIPFFWFRDKVLRASGTDYVVGGVGLILGLFCGNLLQPPLATLPGKLGAWLPSIASLILAYFGVVTMVHHKRELASLFGAVRKTVPTTIAAGEQRVLVDTSTIIDGRIADVAATGFLFCTLVVPRFVLLELQHVADSADAGKRARGRRGLEVLEQLQKDSLAPVDIANLDVEGTQEVDSKLVRLAREREWPLLTNDWNLNRVAGLQGIKVLNINQLANALRMICIPGEALRVKVVHTGKDAGQGVGYLPDGTMVVVESASKQVGDEVEVVVTRAIQTAAGRIIFARPRDRANGQG
jgi:uncharacterized protein YacL